MNDLAHGDVIAAASSNLVFVVAVPFIALAWLLWVRRRWQGSSARELPRPAGIVTAFVVVLGIFTLLRNLPIGSWLAP